MTPLLARFRVVALAVLLLSPFAAAPAAAEASSKTASATIRARANNGLTIRT